MTYETIPWNSYLKETLALLDDPGLFLVTAGADGKANAMTIGWGTMGIIWGKPNFTVMVRPSRYTYTLIEQSDSFTVCVPSPAMHPAVEYCGQYSGRDGDKLAACKLAVIPSTIVKAPAIDGCPLIYECRIVHKHDMVPSTLAKDITAYPKGNYHRVYNGQIMTVRALVGSATLLG
jgi:flavin reductase (DIM6/NTAB) family NADH-FMN oxidoreductase RutF